MLPDYEMEIRELRAKLRRANMGLKVYTDSYLELENTLWMLAWREHTPDTVKTIANLALQLLKATNTIGKGVKTMQLEYTDQDIEPLRHTTIEPEKKEERAGGVTQHAATQRSWLDQAIRKD